MNEMAEILLVKLTTGEEVLTKFEEHSNTTLVTLHEPVMLQVTQKGVGMMPLSPFMKENAKIVIERNLIVYTVEPDEDVVDAYNKQFGITIAAFGQV